jgi:hypothetical protein
MRRPRRGFVERSRAGVTARFVQMSGFALSIIVGGIAAVVSVPAMVAAGGAAAWGAVAIGQAIGLVASTVVLCGWNRSGPSAVALADASGRRREYLDSLRLRFAAFGPVALAAVLIAVVLTPGHQSLAALGALVATLNGFMSIWYFVGTSQAYTYFVFETLPRVIGTVVGIELMRSGFGVGAGLISIGAGLVLGSACATLKILSFTANAGASPRPKRSLSQLLAAQRDSLSSTVGAAVYNALPLSIVSVVAPASQPVFALADKMLKQFSSATYPLVTAIQGWVPRAPMGPARVHRARIAIVASCGISVVLAVGTAMFGGQLLAWMGNGQIATPNTVIVLVAAWLALGIVDGVLAQAVLSSLGMVKAAVRATYISAAVGLPLVILGAIYFGAVGALGGVLAGFVVRIVIELFDLKKTMAAAKSEPSLLEGSEPR